MFAKREQFVRHQLASLTNYSYNASMTIMEHNNYRTFLKQILVDKTTANPRFSLRALSSKLEIAPSYFSEILKGKKNLSPEKALLIANRLGLKASEKKYFCALVQIESTEDPELKESFVKQAHQLNPKGSVQDLSLDHFRIISDWHHFAMMAATELTQFKTTAEHFAKALGISPMEADLALGRLERLQMIEKGKDNQYRKTKNNPRVVSHSPNLALRNFHKQTLTKAIESLEKQSPKEKIVGSETLAFDSSQMDEIRELTEVFFNQVLKIAKKAKKKDSVYHLGVQFFNLTHAENKEKNS